MRKLDEIKEKILEKSSERFLSVSDNFLSALDVISETPTGKKLIKQIKPFKIKFDDNPLPYISLMHDDTIFFPSDCRVDGNPNYYIRSLSHEMKHLVQKQKNLLPMGHAKKGSIRDFFLEEKLAEASAEVTSNLIFYEMLGFPRNADEKQKYYFLGKKDYSRNKGAEMIKELLSPFSGDWGDMYRQQALQHVSHIALTSPERILEEGQPKRHYAVLKAYAKEYVPFLSIDELDVITSEDTKAVKKLEKICSSNKKSFIRRFIRDIQNEHI